MNVLKEKRKEAAERQNVLASKKYEEEYNEYKAAFKKEKKINDTCSKEFEKLMSILEQLDEKLNDLRVESKSFVELCKFYVINSLNQNHSSLLEEILAQILIWIASNFVCLTQII